MRTLASAAVVGLLLAQSVLAQGGPASPMSADTLEKLHRAARASPELVTNLTPPVARLLGVGKEGQIIPFKQLTGSRFGGEYSIAFSVWPGSDQIVLSRSEAGRTSVYVTTPALVLTAAAVLDESGAHLVPNEQAAEGFQDALKVWVSLADRIKN